MLEEAMQLRSDHYTVGCLTTGLDLDFGCSADPELFEAVNARCTRCKFRDICALALRRARADLAVAGLCQ
jgi:hypothetical protein